MSFRSFAAVAIVALALAAPSSHAQTAGTEARIVELRVTGGGFVPTGALRESLDDAQQTTAQLSWRVKPSLSVNGTFSWARSRDVSSTERSRLDVFTSDIGIEARPARWMVTGSATFSPFVGAGAGMRSYNYRSLDVDATHNPAAYLAAGGELGFGRVGLRVELREYVSGFKALTGGHTSAVRNDLSIMTGLRFNRRTGSAK